MNLKDWIFGMMSSKSFYNNLPVETIDMIQKLAFVYWYEDMQKRGYNMKPNDTQLYETVRHEVIEYGSTYAYNNSK